MDKSLKNKILEALKTWVCLPKNSSSEYIKEYDDVSCLLANCCLDIINNKDKTFIIDILQSICNKEEKSAFIRFIGLVADVIDFNDKSYTMLAIPIISGKKFNVSSLSAEQITEIEFAIHQYNSGSTINDLNVYPALFSANALCKLSHFDTNALLKSMVKDHHLEGVNCTLNFSEVFNTGDNAIFILATLEKDSAVDLRNFDKQKSLDFGSRLLTTLDINPNLIGYLTLSDMFSVVLMKMDQEMAEFKLGTLVNHCKHFDDPVNMADIHFEAGNIAAKITLISNSGKKMVTYTYDVDELREKSLAKSVDTIFTILKEFGVKINDVKYNSLL